MRKTSVSTINLMTLLLGESDTGAGAPVRLPGHVEDRIASMGHGAKAGRRRGVARRRTST